jgi:CRISPR-associated exonuclease Cas4
MTGEPVPRGAIFHATSGHRREVEFHADLRRRLQEAVARLRDLLQQTTLPEAPNDARCRNCSLNSSCLPQVVAESKRVARFLSTLWLVEE